MWFEEPIRCKICLHTFLVLCFRCGMHMHLVFTTRFEMVSVFIVTGQEVLTLVALHMQLQHCKVLGDTSGLAI